MTAIARVAINPLPVEVRRIGPADLAAALAEGWRDFMAAPTQLLFLASIYPLVGIVAARLAFGADLLPMLYPVLAGLALLGPFAATGLYELSRRRERGLTVTWLHAFDFLRSPALPAILAVGLVLLAIFIAWLCAARFIYLLTFGPEPLEASAFAGQLLTTMAGWQLIVVGNLVGLAFASVVMALSVVAFPMLLDRDVGAVVAMQTSATAVLANSGTMALWGAIVVAVLIAGCLPMFVGLAVAMPVLGHATWHLYRRLVTR